MKKEKLRENKAKETKQHIFFTALELLEKQEYEKIKVIDIARAANVSVGAFYHYYTSKMDVYFESYHLLDKYFEDIVLPLLVHETAKERIFCFFEHYARYCSEITSLALTSILYNPTNKNFERIINIGTTRILPEVMEFGLSTGELRQGDSPKDMSRFFLLCIGGLVYNWCISDGSYDLIGAVAEYVERLLRVYSIGIVN